jgi:hypothetical protein
MCDNRPVRKTRCIPLLVLSLLIVSCTDWEGGGEERTATATATSSAQPDPLGFLAEHHQHVTYQRAGETSWPDASDRLPLFAYDAVQTHEKADALLSLKHALRLEMGEKTLVILSPGASTDRAVLDSGRVTGETDSEAFVLTASALLRIGAGKSGEKGKARISVDQDKQLRVELLSGSAEVRRTVKEGEEVRAERTELALNKPVELPSGPPSPPKPTEEYWKNGPMVVRAKIAPPAKPQPGAQVAKPRRVAEKPARPAPARAPAAVNNEIFLSLESPRNYQETTAAEISLRGTVSGPGGSVRVNGEAIHISTELGFATKVPLQLGVNIIVVQLIRLDGKSVFQRRTVVRKD